LATPQNPLPKCAFSLSFDLFLFGQKNLAVIPLFEDGKDNGIAQQISNGALKLSPGKIRWATHPQKMLRISHSHVQNP
jgi:hypothetical protein